jgi:hypothetical protein
MIRRPARPSAASRGLILISAMMLAGCAAMPLRYSPTPRQRIPVAGTVGVYLFEDARAGWPRNAPARTIFVIGGPVPTHQKADSDVSAFVTAAVRAELAGAGATVLQTPEFDRTPRLTEEPASRLAPVNRVVLGRINYFGCLQGGPHEEAISEAPVPTAKAFVDLDVWVVVPSSGEIVWAGTTRHKHDSGERNADAAPLVAVTLRLALLKLLGQTDFWAALGGAQVKSPVREPRRDVSHGEATRSLLRSGRVSHRRRRRPQDGARCAEDVRSRLAEAARRVGLCCRGRLRR